MRKILPLLLCFAAAPGWTHAQRSRAGSAAGVIAVPTEDPADSLYRLGRLAIGDNDYRRAASLFDQVVRNYPNSDAAPGALYWKAWALYHIGLDRHTKNDLDEAVKAIEQLQKSYAKSAAATTDAPSLRAQIQSAQAVLGDANAATAIATEARSLSQPGSCSGSKVNEEMRVAALEGLLNMNADDAVPILRDVLKQRDPCRIELRKKAVWLISQKRAPDVVSTLLEVARSDPSTEVQKEAIFWLSQTRSDQAVTALDSVLFSVGSEDMRKEAIFALSQQKHDERARAAIRRAAESDRMSEELRGEAIFWLGQSGLADLDYFKTLFQKTMNVELRKKIVFAVSQTRLPGASAWLIDMARDKSADIEIRKDAVFYAAQGKELDFPRLSSLYDQSKGDDAFQEHILFVLSQRRETAAVDKLMDVAKNDPNIERRKNAIFWLGQRRNDPRVTQFLKELIIK